MPYHALKNSFFIKICKNWYFLFLFTIIPFCFGESTIHTYYNRSRLTDFSGHGNTITNYGALLYETSEGWMACFDGVNDYFPLNHVGSYTTVVKSIFFDIILPTNPVNESSCIYQETGNLRLAVRLSSTNILSFYTRKHDTSYVIVKHTNDYTRTSYAYIRSTNSIRLYVNGILQEELPYDGTLVPITMLNYPYNILCKNPNFSASGTEFTGQLGSFYVFEKQALTSNEVCQMYTDPTSFIGNTNLILFLPMKPGYIQ